MAGAKDGTRLIVIGAGPGGYPAAFLAADLGMEVTLVDPEENPGGVCLYRGCIPSKALLHVARVIHETREAAGWGLKFSPPEIDLKALRGWKEKVVGKLTGGLGAIGKQRGVHFLRGMARFVDAHTVSFSPPDGPEQQIGFDHAIIATGSVPVIPSGLSLDTPRVMDSTAALELENVPKTLLVIGGGYVGLEMGTVYAALGTKVTVVEMTSSLLPGVDSDLVELLARRLKDSFAEILLDTKVVEMVEEKRGIGVKLAGLDLQGPERLFEKVLVAVGRRPNSSQLGLENTVVERDSHDFIQTDGQRRTREPSIFAIGDVAGEPMLAHKATHEARIAVEAIADRPSVFDPQAIPAVVYTDPEIAWCGLTDTEARNNNRPFKVARFPWTASGRAHTLDRSDGLTKLILDPRSGRILGVGIVGAGAGELIAEGVLAIEMGATVEDLPLVIHPHPTLSETVMEAAEVFAGHSPHFLSMKR